MTIDGTVISWNDAGITPEVSYDYDTQSQALEGGGDIEKLMHVILTLEALSSSEPYIPPVPESRPEDEASDGWQQDSAGRWYYYQDGEAATGWVKDSDTWYYLVPETGAMATGWQYLGGKWYYLYTWGGMAYNTTIEGYVLGADGAMR